MLIRQWIDEKSINQRTTDYIFIFHLDCLNNKTYDAKCCGVIKQSIVSLGEVFFVSCVAVRNKALSHGNQ